MSLLSRSTPIALSLFFMVGFVPAQTPTPFDAGAATASIEKYLHRNAVPGAVVVVTDGDRIVYEEDFGHESNHQAITPHTALPIASLSNSVTAMAVM